MTDDDPSPARSVFADPPRSSPPSSPPNPAPAPGGPRSRSTAFVAVVVGVAILLIAAGVAALIATDDRPVVDTAATTSTTAPATSRPPTTAAPSTTAAPAPTTAGGSATTAPPASELEAFISDAIAFIQKQRGFSFMQRPSVVVLDDNAFVKRFNELVDQDTARYAKEYDQLTAVYQALGVLGRDQTYPDAQKELGATGVLGYYDPESKELRVRAGSLSPLARTTIVHELTHALDDQYFNLDRPEYDDATDEVSFGFSAVAEGSARRIENAYRATMSAADRAAETAEERQLSSTMATAKLTQALVLLEVAPYDYGEPFVSQLIASGGEAALARAFNDPPHTSEQVLDPSKYFAKEGAKTVVPPKADGEVVQSGIFGEVTLVSLLATANSDSVADAAAAGWSGDWFVAWRESNKACIRADFVMDSSKDTTELKNALANWAKNRPSGKVATVGDAVELTSCSR